MKNKLILFFALIYSFFIGRVNSQDVKSVNNIKGIHLSAWVAGSKKERARIEKLLNETELNGVVIAIKEFQGQVYIPGVKSAEKYKTYVPAMPDIQDYLQRLKAEGIYTIARIVVFKDNTLPRKLTELGVKNTYGHLWQDNKGLVWTDPYKKEVWDYNLEIAEQAAKLGFDEVQFDYIRFPSDGKTWLCRYSRADHSKQSSVLALSGFLEEAKKRLEPLGVKISICLFGLSTSVNHDMGIGHSFTELANIVDFVCPMLYPSHYAKGEYGLPDPNKEPYKTVYKSVESAKKKLGQNVHILRPYLQDFSLGGVKYGPDEVKAEIKAVEDLGIQSWLLWDPKCIYTRGALREEKLEYEDKMSTTEW